MMPIVTLRSCQFELPVHSSAASLQYRFHVPPVLLSDVARRDHGIVLEEDQVLALDDFADEARLNSSVSIG